MGETFSGGIVFLGLADVGSSDEDLMGHSYAHMIKTQDSAQS